MFSVVVGNPQQDIGFHDGGLGSTWSPPLGREFDLLEHFERGVHGRWCNLSFVENGQRERERERERVIKTCKGIHELCSIKIQRGFGRFDYLYRRMEATRYRLLEKNACLLAERLLKRFAVLGEIVPGQAS